MPSSSPDSPRAAHAKSSGGRASSPTAATAFESMMVRLGGTPWVKRVVGFPVGTVVVALSVLLVASGKLSFSFGALHALMYALIALSCLVRLASSDAASGLRRVASSKALSWFISSELATLPLAGIWLASSAFGADALLVFPLGLLVVSAATARISPQAATIAVVAALALATAQ